jgi:glycosyltransferase involved in cell wall biosynthesis
MTTPEPSNAVLNAARVPRRPRIAEILEATVGGTRRHLLYILHGLDSRRFDLTFIFSAERDPDFRKMIPELEALGVECVEAPMCREIHPLRDLRALRQMVGLLARGRFDAVHAHSSKAGFLGRIAARLAGVPKVFYTPHVYYFQACSGVRYAFYWLLEWLAGLITTRTLAVARSQRDIAVRAGVVRPRDIVVVENGVDTVLYGAPVDPRAACAAWGVDPDRPVVGMVARLMHQKGCDLFLRVAARVHRDLPGVQFVLAGEGDLRDDIERERRDLGLEHVVKMAGHCEDPRPVYAMSDVVISTSRYEGLPYVLLEAMAAGCALVVTDVPGNRDLVRDGWNGYLVPQDDVEGFAARVRELATDRDVRSRMAAAGRDLVARGHSRELFLARLEQFLLHEV